MRPIASKLLICLGLVAAAIFSVRLYLRPPSDSELVSIVAKNRERLDQLGELLSKTGDMERTGLTVYLHDGASATNAPYANSHPEWREGDIRGLISDLGAVELAIWPHRIAMLYYYRHPGLIEGIAYWPIEARKLSPELLVRRFKNVEAKPGIYIEPIDDKWCVFAYRTV
jgi:hypothetical protein